MITLAIPSPPLQGLPPHRVLFKYPPFSRLGRIDLYLSRRCRRVGQAAGNRTEYARIGCREQKSPERRRAALPEPASAGRDPTDGVSRTVVIGDVWATDFDLA